MSKTEVLKTALEALELASECLKKADAYIRYAGPSLLIHSEQEPVEYHMRTSPSGRLVLGIGGLTGKKCSKEAAEGYIKLPELNNREYETRNLYTTPPKRKPLTDEQIADYLGDKYLYMTQAELRFFKLGEKAAHGIKETA